MNMKRQVRAALSHVECDVNESDEDTKRQRAGVLNSACCACPCASRHSRCCPQWSHRC